MKAILLAAGLGTRLKPITDTIPKCLVPIKGKPLLQFWIEKLIELGISEILINTHYKSDQVERFINQNKFSKNITLVNEVKLKGTGGTLLSNKTFWEDNDVLVAHADNFTLSSLFGLLKVHESREQGIDTTMLLFETADPKSCGVVKLDNRNIITEYHEKVAFPPSNIANGATFIFAKGVYERYFSNFDKNTELDLCRDIIPNMIGRIKGWHVDDFFIDIGTPYSYKVANNFLEKRMRKQ